MTRVALSGCRRAVRLVAVAVAAAACTTDTLGPDDLPGAYTLRSIRGRPMPVTFTAVPWIGTSTVLRGSLVLTADSTATQTIAYRIEQSGEPVQVNEVVERGRFFFRSDTLMLMFALDQGPGRPSTTSYVVPVEWTPGRIIMPFIAGATGGGGFVFAK